jgi:hypothetical protein
MRVKVGVHESKVDQLRQGMRARIRVQDREFQGSVVTIANRPDQDYFMATAKKYSIKVKIDGTPKDLRPGMTAEVEILVAHLENVISLPVAAVAEKSGQNFCCVKNGSVLERRNVVLGQGNDKFVEVKGGVEVGEEVVLNPRAALGETAEESQKQPESDVKKKFGAETAKSQTDQKQSKDAKSNSSGDSRAQAPEDAQRKAADKSDGKAADKSDGKAAEKPDGKAADKSAGKTDGKGEGKADGDGNEKAETKGDGNSKSE